MLMYKTLSEEWTAEDDGDKDMDTDTVGSTCGGSSKGSPLKSLRVTLRAESNGVGTRPPNAIQALSDKINKSVLDTLTKHWPTISAGLAGKSHGCGAETGQDGIGLGCQVRTHQ